MLCTHPDRACPPLSSSARRRAPPERERSEDFFRPPCCQKFAFALRYEELSRIESVCFLYSSEASIGSCSTLHSVVLICMHTRRLSADLFLSARGAGVGAGTGAEPRAEGCARGAAGVQRA